MQVTRHHLKPVYMTALNTGVWERTFLALTILFVTLPFVIPRLVGLQLSIALARYEGLTRKTALTESAARLKGLKWPLGLALAAVRVPVVPSFSDSCRLFASAVVAAWRWVDLLWSATLCILPLQHELMAGHRAAGHSKELVSCCDSVASSAAMPSRLPCPQHIPSLPDTPPAT